MDPRTLCTLHQCRIVHFMFHDRVSFGGTLLGIGTTLAGSVISILGATVVFVPQDVRLC
jgi:hypothetical protein